MTAPLRRLFVFPDPESLGRAAATWTVARLDESFSARGRAALALSGGSSPVPVLQALSTPPLAAWPRWREVTMFWVDERAVPPEDEASNYGLARRHLMDRLPDPPRCVHRVRGELSDLEAEARRYAGLLEPWAEEGVPCLDVVLLGAGTDGHVASLFPGSPLLEPGPAWVGVAEGPPPHRRRLTLTPPVLDAARHAAYVVTGRSKRALLQALFAEPPDAEAAKLPAARLRKEVMTEWFVDADAAGALAGA